jgi:ABC-type Zn2+ transport system substrate-binding protein/surface adhesin
MLEVSNAVMALISLILTLIATVIGAFAYVTARISKVSDTAATAMNRQREVTEANIASLREVMAAKIDGLAERESKQRHDLRNELQNICGKQDADITVAQRNVDEVLRDAIRRADLTALRTELIQAIATTKTEAQQNLERAEAARARTNERLAERIETMMLRIARLPEPPDPSR